MSARNQENTEDVEKQLCWDSSLDTRNIRVDSVEGKIQLSGTVPSYAGRVNAFRDALNTASGMPVINRLTVDFPREAAVPPDEMLESHIREITGLVSWLAADNIKVRVSGRRVYLSGQTEFLWQKIRLERLVGELKGVAGIMNEIEVKPGMHLSDNRIAGDLIDSLNRIKGFDSSGVGINVINGRVFLEGRVRDSLELMAVERAAALTRGVTDAINDIRIRE